MKKVGTYTARGQVPGSNTGSGDPVRLFLFDGKFTSGYVVTDFKIWSSAYDSDANADGIGKLSKSASGNTTAATFMNAADDDEIAWATTEGASVSGNDAAFNDSIIDPDNLIVEDLYIYTRNSASKPMNYLITMDKYDIPAWKGALSLAKDKAQGE